MDRIIMSYYTCSLLLTAVGTVLSLLPQPTYAAIIMLPFALMCAIHGYKQSRE